VLNDVNQRLAHVAHKAEGAWLVACFVGNFGWSLGRFSLDRLCGYAEHTEASYYLG
jgi:hypothetical protein